MLVKFFRDWTILFLTRVSVFLLCASRADCQGFLWTRIPTDFPGIPELPTDCIKSWGPCLPTGEPPSVLGAYYRNEQVVVEAKNGGECTPNIQRFCDAACQGLPPCPMGQKKDCVKVWSDCFGDGPNSYKIEKEVEPAQNGGQCELKWEFGCNTIQVPVDCRKRWGRCVGVGPGSHRDEEVVEEAKFGGRCNLRREFGCNLPPVDCVKEWGRCVGQGPESSRSERVVQPAENGGECEIRVEKGCNPYKPVNCRKRWGRCAGCGPKSVRSEEVVTPARHGGKCDLKKETGCNSRCPVDCEKKWGKCRGSGPSSFRDEEIVKAAKFGGKCVLGREFGCNINKPVDCKKKKGPCVGNGPDSVRKETVVTPPLHGGKCDLKVEKGCRFDPVDCVKEWGKCKGIGKDSSRKEVIVTKAMYGGNCLLRTQKECNTPPEDCKTRWGPCKGVGPGSFRDEEMVTEAKYGGTCNLQREFGCNKLPEQPPATGSKTNGETLANVMLANFVSDPSSGPTTGARSLSGAGARSLSFNIFIPGLNPTATAPEPKNKTCNEFKVDNISIAIGCDDANDIDLNIIKEEEKIPRRSGVKRPPSSPEDSDLSRRRRSTGVAKPKPESARDVLFYLDSSGSVGPYHFNILKEVCKAIVDALCGKISLGKWQTRIAMATFNARQLLSFPFTTTSETAVVKKKIDSVSFDYDYSYQSCIRDALKFVLNGIYLEKHGARDPSFAEGDMFFMTDGCANCDFNDNTKELQRLAYRLKLNKINIYAIGVGIKENCREILKVLARGGRCFHFFFLDDWDHDVEDFLRALKNPPQQRCLSRWEHPGVNCLEKSQG